MDHRDPLGTDRCMSISHDGTVRFTANTRAPRVRRHRRYRLFTFEGVGVVGGVGRVGVEVFR